MELFADVIVIGAGLAGLTASQYLTKRGIKTIILESRDRIGGRVVTKYLNVNGQEVACFMGSWNKRKSAHWITESDSKRQKSQNSLYLIYEGTLNLTLENEVEYKDENKLFEELHLIPTSEDNFWMSTDSSNEILFDGHHQISVTKEFLEKYHKLFQEIKELAQTTTDQSFSLKKGILQTETWKQFSKGNEVERKLLNWFLYKIEVWMSSNLDDITLTEFAADFGSFGEFEGSHCISKDGLGKVVEFLSKDLDIRLEHQVVKIDSRKDKFISIRVQNGSIFQCKYVICTIPLGVLKEKSRELFSPPLSDNKLACLEKLKMGAYGKVVLHFENAFWDEFIQGKQSFIGSISNDPNQQFCLFLNYSKLKGVPILITFMIDTFARKLEKLSENEVVQLAVDSLLKIFPQVKNPKLCNSIVTKWNTDPHSMGAYSYLPLGCGSDDVNELMIPEADDRLFFAGEAAEFEYQGSLHGSYLTGIEQARRLADMNAMKKSLAARL